MAVTTTSRNQFAVVTINTESTTWGAYWNDYNITRLDQACGGNLSITLTTSSYTLNDTVPTDETHYDNYLLTQTYNLGHSTVVIPNRDGVWNFTIIPYGGSSSYGVRFNVDGTANYTRYFTNSCNVKLQTNSGAIAVLSCISYAGANNPLGPFYTGSVTTSAQTMYLTFDPVFKSLSPGMMFEFAPGTAASESTMSIVVDSISGKTLYEASGEAIDTTSWTSTTGLITCQYNGTSFNKIAPAPIPPDPPIWTTGDTKLTYKTVADVGWIIADDGTIGNSGSGATTRANADTEDLYTLFWGIDDSICPVSGGRGASAAADFAANKTIALPKLLGRAPAIAGTGTKTLTLLTATASNDQLTVASTSGWYTGMEVEYTEGQPISGLAEGTYYLVIINDTTIKLATSVANAVKATPTVVNIGADWAYANGTLTHTFTTHSLGDTVGEETHALTINELPSFIGILNSDGNQGSGGIAVRNQLNLGSNIPHNIMQPTAFLNLMIKL